jgi:HEAT repeat protein
MVVKFLRNRKLLCGATVLFVLSVGAAAWTERVPLLAWFYVRGLSKADETTRDRWVERVAGLNEAVVPNLLDTLARPEPAVCANTRAALTRLSSDWVDDDARREALVGRIARSWVTFSIPGKACALEVATGWFRTRADSSPGLVSAAAGLLTAATREENRELQARALDLCAALLPKSAGDRAVSPGRSVVRACLTHTDSAIRLLAIRLALFPGMDLLEDIVPLLSDPVVEVRRAAIVVVGPAEQAVRDEGLLPCLHDDDAEVRRLSELALCGRGLSPEHIKLGRILTDPSPIVRLQVLDQLRLTPDLDAGIWLRRLSHDPSPAVRAAAMRAMCQQSAVDLTDRIDQMARDDPSPTICMLARFYLRTAHPVTSQP